MKARKLFLSLVAVCLLAGCGDTASSSKAPASSSKAPVSSSKAPASSSKAPASSSKVSSVASSTSKTSSAQPSTSSTAPAADWKEVSKDGVVHKETKGEAVAYRLDVAEATGWNSNTKKMNGKTSPSNESDWDITDKIPAGKYAIELEGMMTYSSHTVRTFANQWENDPTPDSSPDKQTEDPFRYFFKVDDGAAINPDVTKTWGDLGYEDEASGGSVKFAEVHTGFGLAKGAKKFSLLHGNIGYSMIINRIRLVYKGANEVTPTAETAYKATFVGLQHCKLYEYTTGNGYQDDPTIQPTLVEGTVIWSRSKADGSYAKDQTDPEDSKRVAQWNFKLVPDAGWAVISVTPDTANYKNLKGPTDLSLDNTYSATQVKGDVTFTVVIQVQG